MALTLKNLKRCMWLRTICLVSGDELGQTLTVKELGEFSSHVRCCGEIGSVHIRVKKSSLWEATSRESTVSFSTSWSGGGSH